MKSATRKPAHFLLAWRLYARPKKISLRRLSDMLAELPRPYETSDASLNRIEHGKQPYNQPLLEALAAIYGVEPGELLMRHPLDSAMIWTLWGKATDEQRVLIVGLAEQVLAQRRSEAAE